MGIILSGCQKNGNVIDNTIVNHNEEEELMKEDSMYYNNPISSIEETTWYDYGTGDPYVMRYNGTYYLYCSTRDTEVGVKCWSSRDLIKWIDEGLCSTETITKGAYAPEVVYYNGKFYMYTSPAGNGHYVLSSNSPTGPFAVISDNLGMSIDGSVFIDDDGKWYFYHSDVDGIRAHEMTSPKAMDSFAKDVNAKMNGWTEGPMVIKHDGKYYLTYTGNHVFSKGYRINYGVGITPVAFAPSADNPVLIHTEGDVYGIGHSSSVKGPDLDSYYMVYHSLVGHAVEGMPKRVMNIDRIVFNGNSMDVLGPTESQQQKPDMPEVYSYFDSNNDLSNWNTSDTCTANSGLDMKKNSRIFSKEAMEKDYTAEYNVSSSDVSGQAGAIFSYVDKNHYGQVGFDLSTQQLVITFVEDGVMTTYKDKLPKSFNEDMIFTSLQSIQVEKYGKEFTFYVNDRSVAVYNSNLEGGKIGYYTINCGGSFGFIGGSNEVKGSSAKSYKKPVPGTIQAMHYSLAASKEVKIGSLADTEYLKDTKEGEWYKYNINVEEDGEYDFSMKYATSHVNTSYALYLDDILVSAPQEILTSTGAKDTFMTEIRRAVPLTKGYHELKFNLVQGEAELANFTLLKNQEVKEIKLDYESILDDFTYSDGRWKIQGGRLLLGGKGQSVGKRLYGSENWGDYSVETDIKVIDEEIDAGILFRVSNPSLGEAGNSALAGTNFLQGYFAGINSGELVLVKQNYNWNILQAVPFTFIKNQTYHMKVIAVGDNIKIYINDDLCIDFTDSTPFTQGKVGLRGHNSIVEFDNFQVSLPDVQ